MNEVEDFLDRRWEDILFSVDSIDTARVVREFNEYFKIPAVLDE